MSDGPGRDLMVLFGLCDAGRGVPRVFNAFIVIAWTQLEVISLRMLSVGQHLAVLCPNPSITRPQISVSEEPPAARNRS